MKTDKPTNMLNMSTISIAGGIMCYQLNTIIDGIVDPIAPLFFFFTAFIGISWHLFTQNKFTILFKNLGLGTDDTCYPLIKYKTKTENSVIYHFTLPTGLSLSDFKEKQEAIQQFLGYDIDIRYTFKEIVLEVFKEELKSSIPYEPIKIFGEVPIFVGYDRHGNLINCNLANGEPHMLIAGETGSGKSTVIRSIITNLILKSKVNLHLVDLKSGTEFNVFQKSKSVLNFCKTIKEAEKLLDYLSCEVDNRYNLFYENDVKDIVEYNSKFPKNKLAFELLIIDEFADLQDNKSCKGNLDELGRKARACGIHMILSTQRPDAKVLSGNIKANVTTVIGLKTLNGTNSNIIIGETGLEKLRGKGHGQFKRGNITEIQAPYIDVEQCRELIKHTYVNKIIKPKEEEIDFSKVAIFDAN